jgi:hypothetical protein
MSPETLLLRNDPYKLIRVPCIGKRYNRTHTQTHSCESTLMRKHTHAKAHSCESTLMRKHTHAKAHSCESTLMRKHIHAKAHPCESTLKHISVRKHIDQNHGHISVRKHIDQNHGHIFHIHQNHGHILQGESTLIRIMVIYFGAKAHSSESWSYFSAKAPQNSQVCYILPH